MKLIFLLLFSFFCPYLPDACRLSAEELSQTEQHPPQQLVWQEDYKAALKKSHEEKKPILLFFSGSDWSGWSMKMKREVVDNPLFITAIRDAFILVNADFPANSSLDGWKIAQNEELKKQYRVQEYPRLLVVDAKGREIARFGMESADILVSELIELLADKARLDAANVHEGACLQEKCTSKELEELYNIAVKLKCKSEEQCILHCGENSQDPLFFLLERYRHLMESKESNVCLAQRLKERIIAWDMYNKKGAHLKLALIDFQRRERQGDLDPHWVIEPVETYLSRFGAEDEENRWRLEMMVAQFYLNYDRYQEALVHAEMASQIVSQMASSCLASHGVSQTRLHEVNRTLDYIRQQAVLAKKN